MAGAAGYSLGALCPDIRGRWGALCGTMTRHRYGVCLVGAMTSLVLGVAWGRWGASCATGWWGPSASSPCPTGSQTRSHTRTHTYTNVQEIKPKCRSAWRAWRLFAVMEADAASLARRLSARRLMTWDGPRQAAPGWRGVLAVPLLADREAPTPLTCRLGVV